MAYLQEELRAATHAVTLASQLCRAVQMGLGTSERHDKPDESPVTVADYGAQAVVAWSLQQAFPDTPLCMVAEEDSEDLRTPAGAAMLTRVSALVNATLCLPTPLAAAQVADLVDLGGSAGGAAGRHWVLDPIDGTRGFVARRQYAVCLALLVGGVPTLGVLGCPNLPLATPVDQAGLDAEAAIRETSGGAESGAVGCLFHAVQGQGAYVRPLFDAAAEPRRIQARRDASPADAVYMTSFESRHSSHSVTDDLARAVGVTRPALKLDSQVKYGLLARGDASIFLRMPAPGYREKIWDHAGGAVIVVEAGGCISDGRGRPLNFGAGRYCGDLQGGGIIAAATPQLHAALVAAHAKTLEA